MPDNIKWDAVFQSIVDTWLPRMEKSVPTELFNFELTTDEM